MVGIFAIINTLSSLVLSATSTSGPHLTNKIGCGPFPFISYYTTAWSKHQTKYHRPIRGRAFLIIFPLPLNRPWNRLRDLIFLFVPADFTFVVLSCCHGRSRCLTAGAASLFARSDYLLDVIFGVDNPF
jgi:hypothetical protein